MKAKKKALFITGLVAMLLGVSVLVVLGWKRISREIEKQMLLKECVVFEIKTRMQQLTAEGSYLFPVQRW